MLVKMHRVRQSSKGEHILTFWKSCTGKKWLVTLRGPIWHVSSCSNEAHC